MTDGRWKAVSMGSMVLAWVTVLAALPVSFAFGVVPALALIVSSNVLVELSTRARERTGWVRPKVERGRCFLHAIVVVLGLSIGSALIWWPDEFVLAVVGCVAAAAALVWLDGRRRP